MCIAITVFYVCRCWLCRIGSWPTNCPLVFMPTGRVSDSQRLLVVGFVCFLSMSMRRYCHISVQEALYGLPCKDERGSSSIRWTLEPFQRWCWGKFWETGWMYMGFSKCIVTILNWAVQLFWVTRLVFTIFIVGSFFPPHAVLRCISCGLPHPPIPVALHTYTSPTLDLHQ